MNVPHSGAADFDGQGPVRDEVARSRHPDSPRSLEEIDAALARLLAETEATVSQLRAELERRQHQAQHAEIERLEHHLAEATVNWSKVKDFFDEALRELTSRRAVEDEHGRAPDDGDG
ncbi:hypothetical protein [Ruania halotolerans]|uniref:hypothetical protein n=1 Tax=Ruania halotolerans TaxID=2897773 RepID=UPI001E335F0B|nr:hypothetical protein [Ruania halotolerans]UFU05645.1 hypothetical protein LQF10_14520 [Ruania halotolerans]